MRISKIIDGIIEPILDVLLDEEQEDILISRLQTLRTYFSKYVLQIDEILGRFTSKLALEDAESGDELPDEED